MKELKWEVAKKELKTGLVFLEFATKWCPDCKMMEPVVKEAENEIKKLKINAKFIRVDAEEANLFQKTEDEFKVLKVPSFFVIKNSVVSHIGYEYLPAEALIKAIQSKAHS